MSDVSRRRFLGTCAAAVPASAVSRSVATGASSQGDGPLDQPLLDAVAHAVLPEDSGVNAVDAVARRFQRWLDGYRPGVERTHGYGTGEIRHTADHPGPRWAAQLARLEEEAVRAGGAPFPELATGRRREMLRDHIGQGDVRLSDPAAAEHVAAAVLAFYYRSPEAHDRCYRAAIRRHACRPLDDVTDPPQRLETSR